MLGRILIVKYFKIKLNFKKIYNKQIYQPLKKLFKVLKNAIIHRNISSNSSFVKNEVLQLR
jgi:hypothetical protein